MNKTYIDGFSLLEVLIAALLFAIIMLGLLNYQQALINQHHYFYSQLRADQIAFQLLDSYPYLANHIVPTDWQYHIDSTLYNQQCKMVSITITPPNKKVIQQQRLICNL